MMSIFKIEFVHTERQLYLVNLFRFYMRETAVFG